MLLSTHLLDDVDGSATASLFWTAESFVLRDRCRCMAVRSSATVFASKKRFPDSLAVVLRKRSLIRVENDWITCLLTGASPAVITKLDQILHGILLQMAITDC